MAPPPLSHRHSVTPYQTGCAPAGADTPCCSAAPCCLRCCCRCCCSSLLQAAVNMSADVIEAWLARPESRQAVEQGEEEADKEGRHAARR